MQISTMSVKFHSLSTLFPFSSQPSDKMTSSQPLSSFLHCHNDITRAYIIQSYTVVWLRQSNGQVANSQMIRLHMTLSFRIKEAMFHTICHVTAPANCMWVTVVKCCIWHVQTSHLLFYPPAWLHKMCMSWGFTIMKSQSQDQTCSVAQRKRVGLITQRS